MLKTFKKNKQDAWIKRALTFELLPWEVGLEPTTSSLSCLENYIAVSIFTILIIVLKRFLINKILKNKIRLFF